MFLPRLLFQRSGIHVKVSTFLCKIIFYFLSLLLVSKTLSVACRILPANPTGLCERAQIKQEHASPFKKTKQNCVIQIILFSNSRQYDPPKIQELLNDGTGYLFFHCYFIWDRTCQCAGLGTGLQLLGVLKSVRLSYSVSIALHAFLWFQKSCRKLIRCWWCLMDNNWWTQQQAYHPINFCIKDLLTLSIPKSVSETVLFCSLSDNGYQCFCFGLNHVGTWGNLLRQ